MTVSSENQLKLREGGHVITTSVWNVVPRRIVATAQIAATPTKYPIDTLSIKNTTGNWSSLEDGQMFWIGTTPGAFDVTVGVVVAGTTSATLKIDKKSFGDPGVARNICLPVALDQYVTVLKFFPLWGRLSDIVAARQRKMGYIQYSDQNANPPPVANIGPWRRVGVDPLTGKAVLPFNAMPPAPTAGMPDRRSFAYGGKTIAGYNWDIDGQTLVPGYSLTDSAIEVEFTPGFYVIGCTVTDSAGKSHKARTNVWIVTASGAQADYSRRRLIAGSPGIKSGQKHSEVSLNILGDTTDLFPGAGWLYTEVATFGGSQMPAGTVVDSFAGYSTDDQISSSATTSSMRVTIKSPLGLWRDLPTASQLLTENRAPGDWQQVHPRYSSIAFVADHILRWHLPAILSNHDFCVAPDLFALRKFSYELNGASIGGHLDTIEQMALANIGSLTDGTTLFAQHPFYMEGGRDLLDVHWTWRASDITSEGISFQRRHRSSVRWAVVYAMVYNGNDPIPYAARAPGGAAAQGVAEPTIPIIILPPDRGLYGVRQVSGHHFARENREVSTIVLKVTRNLDLAEPANFLRLHAYNITMRDGRVMTGRFMPLEVTRTWRNGLKEIQIIGDLEWKGLPGEELPLVTGGAANAPGYNGSWIEDITLPEPAPELALDNIYQIGAAINRQGRLAITKNLLTASPNWKRITGFSGAARDFAINPNSPYISDGAGALEAVFITVDQDGGYIRVYGIADILAETITPIQRAQFALPANNHQWARIFMPASPANLIVAGWRSDAAAHVAHSENNGAAWSSVVNVGAAGTGTVNTEATLGMAVRGAECVIIAPNGVTIDDKQQSSIYYRANLASGFSAVTAAQPTGWQITPGCLQISDVGTVYAGMEKPWVAPDPLDTVTFDVGGYPHYVVQEDLFGGVTGSDVTPEQGRAAYSTTTGANGTSNGVSVRVDLKGDYLLTDLRYKRQVNIGGGSVTVKATVFYWYRDEIVRTNVIEDLAFPAVTPPITLGVFAEFTDPDVPLDLVVDAVSVRLETTHGFDPFVAIYLDDIKPIGTLVEKTRDLRTYRINNPGTVPVWTNVTPDEPSTPAHHYSLALDAALNGNVELVSTDEQSVRYRWRGTSAGASWSRYGTAGDIIGVKRSGQFYAAWGVRSLYLSDNAGSTLTRRLGDWTSAVGPVDIIDGVWVIL